MNIKHEARIYNTDEKCKGVNVRGWRSESVCAICIVTLSIPKILVSIARYWLSNFQ